MSWINRKNLEQGMRKTIVFANHILMPIINNGYPLMRILEEGKFFGVCAGLAYKFGINPNIIRVLFGIGILLGGIGLLAYLILMFTLKEGPKPIDYYVRALDITGNGLVRIPQQGKITGVCAGIGYKLGMNVWIVRLFFIAFFLISKGGGIIVYFLLAWLLEGEETPKDYFCRINGIRV